MYDFDVEKMKAVSGAIIRNHVSIETWSWLQQKIQIKADPAAWNLSFSLVPRKTGKTIVQLPAAQKSELADILPGFTVHEWTIDRLVRVWLLLHADATDPEKYTTLIRNLFQCAEMSELVALYSALPLLAYPAQWTKQCAEGIRSNIGHVLEAIMYHNPYPAAQLDEPAWNQLVLKAIFTGKQIRYIIGLEKRANRELAAILVDYARERWSANRPVDPQLWRLTGPFIDEKLFPAIQHAWQDDDIKVKAAVALAVSQSAYAPARALLSATPSLLSAIENNTLHWESPEVIADQY
jgi:hypothetical protein